jgi:hypothetical protein
MKRGRGQHPTFNTGVETINRLARIMKMSRRGRRLRSRLITTQRNRMTTRVAGATSDVKQGRADYTRRVTVTAHTVTTHTFTAHTVTAHKVTVTAHSHWLALDSHGGLH